MDRESALRGSGAAAVIVTMTAILLATLVSPAFAWTDNALSDLGVTGTDAGTGTTVLLFNGGLIVGGVLGVGFAVALARLRPTWPGRIVAGLFALTMVLMGLVGVFPSGWGSLIRLHAATTGQALVAAAIGVVYAGTITLLLYRRISDTG